MEGSGLRSPPPAVLPARGLLILAGREPREGAPPPDSWLMCSEGPAAPGTLDPSPRRYRGLTPPRRGRDRVHGGRVGCHWGALTAARGQGSAPARLVASPGATTLTVALCCPPPHSQNSPILPRWGLCWALAGPKQREEAAPSSRQGFGPVGAIPAPQRCLCNAPRGCGVQGGQRAGQRARNPPPPLPAPPDTASCWGQSRSRPQLPAPSPAPKYLGFLP